MNYSASVYIYFLNYSTISLPVNWKQDTVKILFNQERRKKYRFTKEENAILTLNPQIKLVIFQQVFFF